MVTKLLKIKIKRVKGNRGKLPEYISPGAAGVDLMASLENKIVIEPNKSALIPTGIAVAIPEGYEGQVRPRSGLALRNSVTLTNSPGTIDSDYRGEIKVIMINHGDKPFVVNSADRIAQMVIAPVIRLVWEEVDELPDTERGKGGFGSSGK